MVTSVSSLSDPQKHQTLSGYLEVTACLLHWVVDPAIPLTADNFAAAELEVLKLAKRDLFTDKSAQLKAGQPEAKSNRLMSFASELNEGTGLIKVGGCLHCNCDLTSVSVHPVILDPQHPSPG